jgi:hypothetical protein
MTMTPPEPTPSREDVLGAYTVEADHGRTTLERYLREYPQFTADLIELSSELAQEGDISTAPLGAEEQALIESAWQRHIAAGRPAPVDPLASLSVPELRAIAQQLGLPRQILAAFRERRVLPESVPRWLAERLAGLLGTPLDEFLNLLARAPTLQTTRSYKADVQPQAQPQVSFEQLLADACVPPDQRVRLLSEKN